MKKLIDIISILAGSGFLLLAILTAFEVLMRKFFNYSFAGVDEIGGYIYAIGATIGFIVAFADNAHIRIDLIVKRFPAGVRMVLNLSSHILLAAFAGLLTWRAGAEWLRSWELGALAPTPLRTPLVLPQGVWLICLAVFTLAVLAKTTIAFTRIFTASVRDAAHYLDIDTSAELDGELISLERRDVQENKR